MTIAIIITLVVLFTITWIVIAVSCTESLPVCCLNCLHTHDCSYSRGLAPICCDHNGTASLKQEISQLRWERDSAQKTIVNLMQDNARLSNHRPIFRAMTVEQQEIVDTLTESIKPLEELREKLSIKS